VSYVRQRTGLQAASATQDNRASRLRSKVIKDLVCLTVSHDKFKTGSSMVRKVSGGWPRVLSSMKSFLETGKGLNVFGGL
jgi:hypothetical protein